MLCAVATKRPTILTNMAYWQSPEWLAHSTSIYPLANAKHDPDFMPWWQEAWTLFRESKKFDVILTMGIRESFAYALLCRLSGRPSRQIMCEVFIDRVNPSSLAWRLKTRFYQWLAKDAIGFITNSTTEISTNAKRFAVPEARLRYVPLSSTIDQPEYIGPSEDYLFCAGRTLRDYGTLRKVMLASDKTWHVVAGANDLPGETFPARITIHREISRENYLALLRGAKIVVLPLLETERATGQVVVLEAMSYGKPCITTRSPGTQDIIRHGENGLLVNPGNAEQIIAATNQLENDSSLMQRLGKKAFADVLDKHSHQRHAEQRLEAVRELWELYSARLGGTPCPTEH